MKVIVITGSTRGIGFGLANSFLNSGCSVIISGRSSKSVENAVSQLSQSHPAQQIFGIPCDTTNFNQVQSLWDEALAHFGKIDIWINNAGITQPQMNLWELSPEILQSVIQTNLLGAMYGSKTAIQGMLKQGFGAVYNMEGLGSDGRLVKGLSTYGASKYAIRYLSRSLIEETKETPVIVGVMSPGMVLTDLLLNREGRSSEEMDKSKRFFNILADRVETVTPWLAKNVLENTRHGARIEWLTTPKIIWRFISSPFYKRDLFSTSK